MARLHSILHSARYSLPRLLQALNEDKPDNRSELYEWLRGNCDENKLSPGLIVCPDVASLI
jgi:hypothetical protein